jgi:putative ATP-binding cassette transporter
MLDTSRRWDRELSEDEQQAVVFARLVLHAPPWVLIDEVLDSLDSEALKRVTDIFTTDLKHTAVIYIGRPGTSDSLFSRVLHLIKDPTIHRLARLKIAEPKPARRAAKSK